MGDTGKRTTFQARMASETLEAIDAIGEHYGLMSRAETIRYLVTQEARRLGEGVMLTKPGKRAGQKSD